MMTAGPNKKIIFSLFFLLAIFLFSFSAKAYYEISSSVVGLYHLEDVVDSSGNGYNFTNSNSVSFVSGLFNDSASFNGSNQYLSNTNSAFNVTSDFTVHTWVKLDTLPTTNNSYVIATNIVTDSNSYGPMYKIFVQNVSGTSRFKAQTWASSGSFLTLNGSTTEVSTSTWYMLDFVKDADNDWKLYVNGSLEVSEASSRTLSATGHSGIRLGADEGSVGSTNPSGSYYDGLIEESAFISRALQSSELTAMYNSGVGNEICMTPGCADTSTSSQATSTDSLDNEVVGNYLNMLFLFFFGFLILSVLPLINSAFRKKS